ncbi:hypothetical protein D3C71_1456810 [compost metagenome]
MKQLVGLARAHAGRRFRVGEDPGDLRRRRAHRGEPRQRWLEDHPHFHDFQRIGREHELGALQAGIGRRPSPTSGRFQFAEAAQHLQCLAQLVTLDVQAFGKHPLGRQNAILVDDPAQGLDHIGRFFRIGKWRLSVRLAHIWLLHGCPFPKVSILLDEHQRRSRPNGEVSECSPVRFTCLAGPFPHFFRQYVIAPSGTIDLRQRHSIMHQCFDQ